MASFKNYNPEKITVTFNGTVIDGFMSGTFVSCERMEDSFSMDKGPQSNVTRVKKNDISGSVTLTLQQTSPSNDDLSAQLAADEISGLGYGALLVTDAQGTTIVESPDAWIRKPPNVDFGDEASGREWVFDCAHLIMNVGGSLQ